MALDAFEKYALELMCDPNHASYETEDDPENEEDYELADFESDEDEDNDFTKD